MTTYKTQFGPSTQIEISDRFHFEGKGDCCFVLTNNADFMSDKNTREQNLTYCSWYVLTKAWKLGSEDVRVMSSAQLTEKAAREMFAKNVADAVAKCGKVVA